MATLSKHAPKNKPASEPERNARRIEALAPGFGPSRQTIEASIVGTLIELNGDPLPPNLSRLLSNAPEAFEDLRHGQVAIAIRELRLDGKPVTAGAIEEAVKFPDARQFISGLANDALPVGLAEHDAAAIWENYRRRLMATLFGEAAAELQSKPHQADYIAGRVRTALDELTSNTLCRFVARPLGDIQPSPADDEAELIRHRFICRGSGALLAGPSGVGKTTWVLQSMLCFSVGRECLGFKPTHQLRSLYIQAENDEADLRELRDGILAGLNFTEEERARAFANVLFVTIDDSCGVQFITSAVEPLCRELKLDILWIDPLLAYIGGDIGRQEVVSPWLRNHLNPILHRYGVACVLVHHTNKPPSGKEKPNWQAGDFAYIGSGSSELANWPRAVIAIRGTGSHDVFELRLGKRGSRAGWKDADGATSYSRFIAHGTDGIYWREATADEQPASAGRKQEHTVDEILALLDGEKLSTAEWQKACRVEAGIAQRTFFRLKKYAQEAKLVSQSKLDKKWFKNQ